MLLRPDRADADQEGLLWRQDRLSTMGEMAAQLAHEIRNPLLAVGATLESLRQDPACPAEHREIMESLGREIVRLDMTLRDYLAARREMSFAPVDLLTVVQDARTLLENAYRLSGKTVTTDIAPDLTVRADREALRHVFFNLLHNALEASPPDGEVVCRATAGRDVVSVTIDDRGPGLAAASGGVLPAVLHHQDERRRPRAVGVSADHPGPRRAWWICAIARGAGAGPWSCCRSGRRRGSET